MRYRIMRLMVMFDLPVETSENRRNYRKFRKALINEGFLMIQFSVYVRVCVNKKSADFMEKRIAAIASPEGLIQSLIMTEKQYNDMHFIAGKPKEDVRNSSERTIIL
ncbi:3'-5' exonuclease and CRISPR-associated Cas2 family protein [Lentilactobacillus buchneri subsp. silagei CD034]|uniref:CRISPR-associated endoribonuclease Cas2 n=2 Tax=Lentilactobacillus buchneri TaxID=1581 RepID=J9WA45_LENBU|nr:3'-5' exonuclease and CRISPR-associated Cas2 family protein [Lentilactobacillus buchneri subsp. silagei CD034]